MSVSIAFTGLSTTNSDRIAFVALDDIAGGQVIRFTDNEWNSTSTNTGNGWADTNENAWSWTAPTAGVQRGTIITITGLEGASIATNLGSAAYDSAGGSARGLSTTNETVYAYLGSSFSAVTTMLGVISNSTAGFSPGSGLLPLGFSIGTNAILLTSGQSGGNLGDANRVVGGDYAAARTAAYTLANWTQVSAAVAMSTQPLSVTLTGTTGNDTLHGGAGNDSFNGNAGNDVIFLGTGDDTADGGEGTDTASYDILTLTSGAGVTVSLGSQGSAQNTVSAGADTLSNFENLIGSKAADSLTGDGGDNVIEGLGGDDTLDGAGGTDTLSYAQAAAGVAVSLTANTATGGAGTDSISNFENLVGGGFNDTLGGSAVANTIQGGAGNDSLWGGDGVDSLDGGTGVNSLDLAAEASAAGTTGNTRSNLSGSSYSFGGAGTGIIFTVGAGTSRDNFGNTDTIANIQGVSAGGGADIIIGNSASNTLSGGAGDDVLDPGSAGDNDVIIGGAGSADAVAFMAATAGVTVDLNNTAAQNVGAGISVAISGVERLYGSSFGDTLTGFATTANWLWGLGGNDLMTGGTGNDFFLMDDGIDTASGGAGNDTYSVYQTGDVVNENANEGNDGVIAQISYALVANVESLTLYGTGTTGIGNGLDNLMLAYGSANTLLGGAGNDDLRAAAGGSSLDGEAGDDLLTGAAGSDTLVGGGGNDNIRGGGGTDGLDGGDGNDTLNGGAASDTLNAGLGNDVLYGDAGADTLNGGGGNDMLDGGAGADSMAGGAGDDNYYVDDAGDVVNEAAGEGYDTLLLSGEVSFTLGAGLAVEELRPATWLGDFAVGIAGNELANVIIGGGLDDTLSGGGGADNIRGADGDDLIDGGDAADLLVGGIGSDIISGGAGADYIDGGSDADDMTGGAGNDIFIVDDFGDVVVEAVELGSYDRVLTSVSFTLGAAAEIELLTMANTAASSAAVLVGNQYSQTIIGDAGNNRLGGGGGNDTLQGGAGNDSLWGGDGVDSLDGGTGVNSLDLAAEASAAGTTGNTRSNLSGSSYSFGGTGTGIIFTVGAGTSRDNFGNTDTIANIQGVSAGGGADIIIGNSASNTLSGGAGDDVLDPGSAGDNDVIIGGAGSADAVAFMAATAGVTVDLNNTAAQNVGAGISVAISGVERLYGSSFGDTLTGFATTANWLWGLGGNDLMTGGTGNDFFLMDDGIDTASGGAGNDTYSVYQTGDVVNENANEGNDGVIAQVSYALVANVESLTLYGTGTTGIGNGLDNLMLAYGSANTLLGGAGNDDLRAAAGGSSLDGEAGDDLLTGAAGSDTLVGGGGNDNIRGGGGTDGLDGGDGNDTLNGGAASDTLNAGLGNDVLYGDAGADTLNGGGGNDMLDGGAGADSMAGGAGDDNYYVDDAGDVVNEAAGEGYDTLLLSGEVSFTLGAGLAVEELRPATWLGDFAVGIAGNELANVIMGGGLDDTLSGGGGNDHIRGAGGDDIIDAGDGADLITAGIGNDSVFGGAGADYIDGGLGADSMTGGAGSDVFFVDNAGDVVVEAAEPGSYDRVLTSVSFTLGAAAEIELLTMNNTAASSAAALVGNQYNQTIIGDAGNNTLTGGGGGDILRGGAGADVFRLLVAGDSTNAYGGRDWWADWSQAEGDKIDVSALQPGQSFIGTAAFSGVAGQVRYVAQAGYSNVMGDLNGDGASDWALDIKGTAVLVAGDFIFVG